MDSASFVGNTGMVLERLVSQIPGFGGAFADNHGGRTYNVYLTDLSDTQSVEQIVRREVPDAWLRGRSIRFLAAKYPYRELRSIKQIVAIQTHGVALMGVDMKCNRFRVQAAAPEYLPEIHRSLDRDAFRDRLLLNVVGDNAATDCTPHEWTPRPDSACFAWRRTGPKERPLEFPALMRNVQEFGGAFRDSAGFFRVYLTDLERQHEVQPFAECDNKFSYKSSLPIRYVQAQYTYKHLLDVQDHLPSLGKGFAGGGVDMRRNRVMIWGATPEDLERMKRILKGAGLPLEMFVFEVMTIKLM